MQCENDASWRFEGQNQEGQPFSIPCEAFAVPPGIQYCDDGYGIADANGVTLASACPLSCGTGCAVLSNDCLNNPCGSNGVCIDDFHDALSTYTCDCPDGVVDDQNCVDECASSPCGDHGTCVDDVLFYTCVCRPGFCGAECSDTAEATTGQCPPAAGLRVGDRFVGDYACRSQGFSYLTLIIYAIDGNEIMAHYKFSVPPETAVIEDLAGCVGTGFMAGTIDVTGKVAFEGPEAIDDGGFISREVGDTQCERQHKCCWVSNPCNFINLGVQGVFQGGVFFGAATEPGDEDSANPESGECLDITLRRSSRRSTPEELARLSTCVGEGH